MIALFYTAAIISVVATVLAISNRHAVHGLLWLIVSFLSLAVIFLVLGAPFAAALEVIIYAGAIVVLLLFVVMLLNLGPDAIREESSYLHRGLWIAPATITALLAVQLGIVLLRDGPEESAAQGIPAVDVGMTLLGPYMLGVQIAGMLLLAGLIGAFHLARREAREERRRR